MKKVLFINTNLAWGGGEKWHNEMSSALFKRNYDVALITQKNSELSHKTSLTQYPLGISKLSFLNPIKVFKTIQIIKKMNPDAVIVNLPSDAKLLGMVKFFYPIKKLIYRRGMPHPIKNSFINRVLLQKFDVFIANSEEIKKSIHKNIKSLESKIRVVFNGVEPLEFFDKNLSSPLRIGNLGRLVDQKGQMAFIDIAKKLKEKNIDFLIEIAGKGPNKKLLQEKIIENNLEDEIKLVGHVNASEFLMKQDLFVFTSYFEGSANALIEAQQHFLPSIAYDTSSNPEVIENNFNGFLVNVDDTNAVVEKIIYLINNPETFKLFRKNAQQKILSSFSYQDKVKQVEGIINNESK